jgi:hypothetical protein
MEPTGANTWYIEPKMRMRISLSYSLNRTSKKNESVRSKKGQQNATLDDQGSRAAVGAYCGKSHCRIGGVIIKDAAGPEAQKPYCTVEETVAELAMFAPELGSTAKNLPRELPVVRVDGALRVYAEDLESMGAVSAALISAAPLDA